jgi:hypothetical protein
MITSKSELLSACQSVLSSGYESYYQCTKSIVMVYRSTGYGVILCALRLWSEMLSPVRKRFSLCSLPHTHCAFITRYFCPVFLTHSLESHYPMQIATHSIFNHNFASLAFRTVNSTNLTTLAKEIFKHEDE